MFAHMNVCLCVCSFFRCLWLFSSIALGLLPNLPKVIFESEKHQSTVVKTFQWKENINRLDVVKSKNFAVWNGSQHHALGVHILFYKR
eukprot:c32207_g1_i1 orf=21-284(+)